MSMEESALKRAWRRLSQKKREKEGGRVRDRVRINDRVRCTCFPWWGEVHAHGDAPWWCQAPHDVCDDAHRWQRGIDEGVAHL